LAGGLLVVVAVLVVLLLLLLELEVVFFWFFCEIFAIKTLTQKNENVQRLRVAREKEN
jgi:hypothetical protein